MHEQHRAGGTQHLESRPVIFLCHTFGGFVVKKVRLWRHLYYRILCKGCSFANLHKALIVAALSSNESLHSIYENTSGIVFLGTLHNGQHPSFGEALASCAAIELGLNLRKHKGLSCLLEEPCTTALFVDLCDGFEKLQLRCPIITLVGNRESKYFSKHRWRKRRSALVSRMTKNQSRSI